MIRLSLLIVFALVSCQPVLKAAYGVKKPTLEQKKDVREFVHRNGIDSTRLVFFRDFNMFIDASQKKLLSFPDAYFFNSQGQLVKYNKTATECNAGVDLFLTELQNFDHHPIDSTRTETDLRRLLRVSNEDSASITVYITFANYIGRLNKEKTFVWVDLIEKARAAGISINYYLVNCDFLREWNIPEETRKALGIKS